MHFKRSSVLVAIVLCTVVLHAMTSVDVAAQGWTKVRFSESPTRIEPAVTYLSNVPVIDGELDDDLAGLPVRHFSTLSKSDSGNPNIPVSYRLAYGAQFFYVYVEAEAEKLAYRDRAYQNGDGFTVVLAAPQPDNAPSEEFYVLACSAVDRKSMEWTRKIFWYYNVDNLFLPTSDDVLIEFDDGGGSIRFELLLPWKDVHPYHPWLSEGIGFNLAVTKAVGDGDRNIYSAVDASTGAENSPRKYAVLSFDNPLHTGKPQTFVRTARGHISVGDTLALNAVTIAERPFTENLKLILESGEKSRVGYNRETYQCSTGLTYRNVSLASSNLPAGGYVAKWSSNDSNCGGESGFSILPVFDRQALQERLDRTKKVLSPGSYTTQQFMIEEIARELAEVYPYETAAAPRIRLSVLLDYFAMVEQGRDAFSQSRGFVRMAYRSKLDDTLQPYVVYLPADFDPAHKYPLLVYLHGSASTERNIIGWWGIPDGFIALGPNGRGPSNWYSWDNAQTDITEAIQAVEANFPIDEDKILLAGFSMGGYGVYRTYYETPNTYCGIAVFSGTPRVRFGAPEGLDLIDFNDERYLAPFKGVPVFVFHGKRDLNVPFAETEQFISKLERAGALVDFHTEADTGHENPNEETMAAFKRWVKKVIAE